MWASRMRLVPRNSSAPIKAPGAYVPLARLSYPLLYSPRFPAILLFTRAIPCGVFPAQSAQSRTHTHTEKHRRVGRGATIRRSIRAEQPMLDPFSPVKLLLNKFIDTLAYGGQQRAARWSAGLICISNFCGKYVVPCIRFGNYYRPEVDGSRYCSSNYDVRSRGVAR